MISTANPKTRGQLEQAAAAQPSPREIRQRMARIRQSWSLDERALRARHHRLRLQLLAASLLASSMAPLVPGE